MQALLVNFFGSVLRQDKNVLRQVSTFEGDLAFNTSSGILIFTLAGLYAFLQDELNLSYPEFQKTLYSGNINEELQKMGGRIEVHDSTGKTKGNVYQLVHIK